MKILVDHVPYYCKDCLFGKSEEKCSLLLEYLREKNRWGDIEPLENCPLISFDNIEIKTEVKGGYYSDDKLKVSLLLDGEELTSDEFVYREYHGSMDD